MPRYVSNPCGELMASGGICARQVNHHGGHKTRENMDQRRDRATPVRASTLARGAVDITSPRVLIPATLYLQQNGMCAWPPCGKPLETNTATSVDHNHATAESWLEDTSSVRGLVHQSCNMVISYVEQALKYLADHVTVSETVSAYLALGQASPPPWSSEVR